MKATRPGVARVCPGDTVGIVAPGFGFPERRLKAGLRRLEAMGFRLALGEHLLARDGYFAGTDRQRAHDLNVMLENPEVRGVWFARGGYGSARLLDIVRWSAWAADPKPLIGYSDVTALFSVALGRADGICLYAPVVAELGDPKTYHAPSLRASLRGETVRMRVRPAQVLRAGRATGRLLGGNLTVLAHLLGTPHAPVLQGAVLFLEDVGEPAYRLDRALHHVRQSGVLDGVAGVLVGSLEPEPKRHGFLDDRPAAELLRETFMPLGVPVVKGVRVGHLSRKWTLPLGGLARIDTSRGWIVLEPRPVASRAGARRR